MREAIALACRITGNSLPPTKAATAAWLKKYVPGETSGQVLSFDEFVVAARQLCPRLFSFAGSGNAAVALEEAKVVGTIDTSNVQSNHDPEDHAARALTPDYPGKGQKSFERANRKARHNPSFGVLRRKANAATLFDYDCGAGNQPILRDVAAAPGGGGGGGGSVAGNGSLAASSSSSAVGRPNTASVGVDDDEIVGEGVEEGDVDDGDTEREVRPVLDRVGVDSEACVCAPLSSHRLV